MNLSIRRPHRPEPTLCIENFPVQTNVHNRFQRRKGEIAHFSIPVLADPVQTIDDRDHLMASTLDEAALYHNGLARKITNFRANTTFALAGKQYGSLGSRLIAHAEHRVGVCSDDAAPFMNVKIVLARTSRTLERGDRASHNGRCRHQTYSRAHEVPAVYLGRFSPPNEKIIILHGLSPILLPACGVPGAFGFGST